MAPISASDIPSISLLYKLGRLHPSQLGTAPNASPAYNDRVGVFRGDITNLKVGAIVNAANNSLLGGGGVDGAIHRRAGPELLAECVTLNGCRTGSSKITEAYNLPCKKVIHAVGPVYGALRPRTAERLLHGCYQSALKLAVCNNLKSIAFSAISTGVYGYPSLDAASVACSAVKEFLDSEDGDKLDKIIFVTFQDKDVDAYTNVLPSFFPPRTESASDKDAATEEQIAEAEATANQLPSVPQNDPSDSGHTSKKQKQEE
ncbi:MACRO domain-containing protein [Poronia punctata]|nr:MACRO domain-containing protein [Poronia punctata]